MASDYIKNIKLDDELRTKQVLQEMEQQFIRDEKEQIRKIQEKETEEIEE